MQNEQADNLKKYKIFGIGIIPTMVIVMVVTLIIIALYEYAPF